MMFTLASLWLSAGRRLRAGRLRPHMEQPPCRTTAPGPRTPLRARQGRSRPDKRQSTGRRMRPLWSGGNILCCAAAALLSMATAPVVAAGQPESALTTSPPAPGDAMRAFGEVETWLRAWDVPEGGDEAGIVDPPAASVTVRSGGRITGRGTDASGAGSLRRAARRAIGEAAGRLPIPREALSDRAAEELASQMTISLELAGALVPISPEKYADAAIELAPGLDGVAVRRGERVEAMFPGTMLATGMNAGRAMASLVSSITGDAALSLVEPARLRSEHGLSFYRFRAVHLAQIGPGRPAIFLHRGGRIASVRELGTAEGLRGFADRLAANLVRRRVAVDPVAPMAGTYEPVGGVYDPPVADAADAALAALALLKYAAVGSVAPERAAAASGAAAEILTALAVARPDLAEPGGDPLAAAAAFLAVRELGRVHPDAMGDSRLNVLDDGIANRFLWEPGSGEEEGGPRLRTWPEEAWATPGAGLFAAALVEMADRDRPEQVAWAREAVRAVYRATPPELLVGQMPWLGWAELSLAKGAERVPAGVALRAMRDLVWTHQLRAEDLPPDGRDLLGGIVFTSSANPLPNWQSARPLAFIATMLGDERLTEEGEFWGELPRVLDALRFLRQLAADEANGFMFADPGMAAGGVRSALWDQRMPVDATAMTLLAAVETMRGVEAFQARQ